LRQPKLYFIKDCNLNSIKLKNSLHLSKLRQTIFYEVTISTETTRDTFKTYTILFQINKQMAYFIFKRANWLFLTYIFQGKPILNTVFPLQLPHGEPFWRHFKSEGMGEHGEGSSFSDKHIFGSSIMLICHLEILKEGPSYEWPIHPHSHTKGKGTTLKCTLGLVDTHTHTHAHIHTHTHTHIHIHAHAHTHIHTRSQTHKRLCRSEI
jgi:hypothetical protein